MRSLFLASALLLAGAAAAQSCGTLAVTGTGAAGTQLTFAVTGATANSFAILLIAENTGTTTVRLPGGTLTLGLASPILPALLGRTNASGDVSRSITVPSRATTAHNVNGQAATFTLSFMPFSLTACASNVAAFTFGG